MFKGLFALNKFIANKTYLPRINSIAYPPLNSSAAVVSTANGTMAYGVILNPIV